MKFLIIFLLIGPQVYIGEVTRVESNVYSIKARVGSRDYTGLVVTKNCWETANSERAVLIFDEKNERDNKIIFVKTKKVCEIRSASLTPKF